MGAKTLLDIRNLSKEFKVSGGRTLKAVNDVSFSISEGETFGLVGESGCGKSTTGRTILQLYNATEGEIYFNGENIIKMNKKQKYALHSDMQMIFQDPYASLNPRLTVTEIISEGMDALGMYKGDKSGKYDRVLELLNKVGLKKNHANRYPHEFSGGQRQRIGIARALAVKPKFIIADEPISALDVSIQAQVVNLFQDLQEEENLTYLFIAHDLSMVKHISDRIGVMYLGKLVEVSESVELYDNPLHPYTQALLSAIPIPDPKVEHSRERIVLQGDVPSPMNPPSGCHFRTRCAHAKKECESMIPQLKEVEKGHFVACHLY
ncbi:ABC transporter ATP-binding protein [Chengkuizengella axinellae]|uniref:ATP-binding cassette domain-containing protein n=1 Tax=Chengkuizengella axinellae TaxID=3064388 RepID=A0ABT9J1T2_9BACL|nr:oligopeptide/dipeptide ABC transporter ATP-binding protein [Chengkuizengella sp. 2205SS18-9]MDP5275540.1 ATP-binding cassette domain-containing protein [Chengkuizengella sp. 2205SS18-9]